MPKRLRLLFIFFTTTFLPYSGITAQNFPFTAEGFDSHVELSWEDPQGMNPASYQVWRSSNGQDFILLKSLSTNSYLDYTGFAGDTPDTYYYYLSALNPINVEIATSDTIQVTVAEMTDEELLTMVQRYTFRYFWDFAHPVSGMARERNTSGDIVTTGGTGFGVMAILVGIERGFITRQQGLDRMLQIVSFLQFADRFHGVFPHWMNGATGNVVPFSQYDDGGDLVETSFLMQGLLAVRSYFDQDDPLEDALRQAITGLWEDVEWDFYRKNNSNVLYWHWSPNYGWQMNHQLRGFNEVMITYLLAIASPTHPVPASLYHTGWAGQNYTSGLTWYGYKLDVGPSLGGPLFFAHYSYMGFDPRNKKDAYTNYFERNKNHTLINRAYVIANPLNHTGYSEVNWGLTASDDPWGYLAHEPGAGKDNGTIAPTAALSSMPYTPAESIAALKYFYRNQGEKLWGEMGFYDAFNLDVNWYATSYLAIDQGPIINMIENYRTGLLWDLFMANPEIQPALDAIGFMEDVTAVHSAGRPLNWTLSPNPAGESLFVEVVLPENQPLSLDLLNVQGEKVKTVYAGTDYAAGSLKHRIDLHGLSSGLYFLRMKSLRGVQVIKFIKN